MGYYRRAALHRGAPASIRPFAMTDCWSPAIGCLRCGRASWASCIECLGASLHEAFHYRDADFVLQGWTRSALSLARNEGLR
jgi:hypothetical protein